MDCESYRISCQLEQIVAQMHGFDLSAFAATLSATLVGAVVAGFISIELYRREVRSRRRGEVDNAVANLISAIQTFSRDHRRFIRASRAREEQSLLAVRDGWVERIVVPEEPDRQQIDTAVEMLLVITDGAERNVAARCRQVLFELSFLEDAEAQHIEYASVRRVLVAWRAQKATVEKTISNLRTIDLRRRLIEDGLHVTLPESPELLTRTTLKEALAGE
ncbi:hypothetical protein [Microbacterium sp.]|uniref:hypothetical protein n=1 Tax=Microbacterium sp. TaxID=51671 RepID=UPI003A93B721